MRFESMGPNYSIGTINFFTHFISISKMFDYHRVANVDLSARMSIYFQFCYRFSLIILC